MQQIDPQVKQFIIEMVRLNLLSIPGEAVTLAILANATHALNWSHMLDTCAVRAARKKEVTNARVE